MGAQRGLHGTLKKTPIFKRCLGKQAHKVVRTEVLQGMEKSEDGEKRGSCIGAKGNLSERE